MSRTIDERIVEMRFDNRDFEQNVQTTMKTLDSFKQALKLDNVTDGFGEIKKAANRMDLRNIASGIEAIERRFSTLGIIGMEVIQKLTDGFLGLAQRGISAVLGKITSGGKKRAFNIEQAHFQLQGLLKDEAKVQAIMDDAMDSVTDTAYGYDEAAKAASMFAASGIEAGEKMQRNLKGLAGVAAMTNTPYENIANTFTTISGQGRILGNQLNQFASYGLNVAATLADYFTEIKGIETTEQDIRDIISDPKKNLPAEEFFEAMAWAFGDQAKKANETVTGAWANVGAALSRIGAKFYSPLIEQNGALVNLFNVLKARINDINKGIDPIANIVTGNIKAIANAMTEFLDSTNLQDTIGQVMTKLSSIFANAVLVVKNFGKGFLSVIKPIGQAFRLVFGYDMLGRLSDFSMKLVLLTHNFKISEKTSELLKKTFSGFFRIFDIGAQAISALIRVFAPSRKEISSFAESILTVTANIGDWITALDRSIKRNDTLFKAFSTFKQKMSEAFDAISKIASSIAGVFTKIFDVFDKAAGGIKNFIDAIKETSNIEINIPGIETFSDFADAISNKFAPVMEKVANVLKTVSTSVQNVINSMLPGLQKVTDTVKQILSVLGNAIKNGIKSADINQLTRFITTGIAVGLGLSLNGALKSVETFVKDFNKGIGGIFSSITKTFGDFTVTLKTDFGNLNPILTQFKDTLKAYQNELNANALKSIAIAIAILSGSLLLLSTIDPTGLTQASIAIAGLFAQLLGSYKVLSVIDNSKMSANLLSSIGNELIKMASSVLILSLALKAISSIDADAMMNSFMVLSALMWEMVGVSTVLSKNEGSLKSGTAGILSFAISLRIIAGAIKTLGKLSDDQLINGLLALSITMGALVFAFNSFKAEHAIAVGAGMLLMANAMVIMSGALRIMGSMSLEQLVTSLAALAGTMLILVMAFNQLGKANMLVTAVSMGILSGALVVMAGALKIMGSLDLKQLITALAALAGTMLILIMTFNQLGKANMLITAAAMLVLSEALVIMAGALRIMGSLNFEQLITALAALAGTMLILVMAFNSTGGLNMLVTAGAMVIMAGAVTVLAVALKVLGSLNLAQMGIALGTLAGAFLILGVAGAVLGPIVPYILALAGAMALIGLSVALAGAGVTMFAAGLGSLVAVGLSGLKEFMEIVKTSMPEMLQLLGAGIGGIAGILAVLGIAAHVLAPLVVEALALAAALALVGAAVALVGIGADKLSIAFMRIAESGEAGINALISMFETIKTAIPTIIAAVVEACTKLIEEIADATPRICEAVGTIITAILALLADKVPEIIKFAYGMTRTLFQTIAENIAPFTEIAVQIVVNFINGISSKIGDIVQCAVNLVVNFIEGMATAIDKNQNRIINAFDRMISSVLTLLGKAALRFVDRGADFLSKLLSGINKMEGNILKAIVNLAAKLLEKIGLKKEWIQKGKDFINGLIDGFVAMREEAIKMITKIGKAIIGGIKGVFDEHSPSKEAYKIGEFFMVGMNNGFKEYGKRVEGTAVEVGEDILDTFRVTMSKISDYVSADYQPTITPVVDLTNVNASAGNINSLFDNTKTQELAWQASADGNFNVMADLSRALNAKLDKFNNDDVVGELTGLRGDITDLSDTMSRLNIVMDTGTLVGALGPGMDTYLGNQAVLAGRGV